MSRPIRIYFVINEGNDNGHHHLFTSFNTSLMGLDTCLVSRACVKHCFLRVHSLHIMQILTGQKCALRKKKMYSLYFFTYHRDPSPIASYLSAPIKKMFLAPISISHVTYVLELEEKKYYVGVTYNFNMRYAQHLSGVGAQWTKLYKPTKILEVIYDPSETETETTLRYMKLFGIKNVRGGDYSKINMSDKTYKLLSMLIEEEPQKKKLDHD